MAGSMMEGDLAPAFSLPGNDGHVVSLEGFRGRPVVVFFYPKDDTSGCTQEAQEFDALSKDFAAVGCAVLGMSPDGAKSHAKFRAKYGLSMNLVSDEAKDALTAYGVWQEKSMYGRKYMGVERSTVLIDADGRIVRMWRKVKVPGHAAEVLAAVRRLAP